nr:MAG: hypothetical protein [Caudoviricetes sp.]
MNTKIKELAEQSGFNFYDLHDIDGQDLGETVEADSWSAVDKFAELIIDECVKVCEDGVNCAEDWDSSVWDQACINRGLAIKSHFGV